MLVLKHFIEIQPIISLRLFSTSERVSIEPSKIEFIKDRCKNSISQLFFLKSIEKFAGGGDLSSEDDVLHENSRRHLNSGLFKRLLSLNIELVTFS